MDNKDLHSDLKHSATQGQQAFLPRFIKHGDLLLPVLLFALAYTIGLLHEIIFFPKWDPVFSTSFRLYSYVVLVVLLVALIVRRVYLLKTGGAFSDERRW